MANGNVVSVGSRSRQKRCCNARRCVRSAYVPFSHGEHVFVRKTRTYQSGTFIGAVADELPVMEEWF